MIVCMYYYEIRLVERNLTLASRLNTERRLELELNKPDSI